MTNITIAIPEDRLLKLTEIAARFRLSPEDLVRASIEEIVAHPEGGFQSATDYVLKKNAELYRRLA